MSGLTIPAWNGLDLAELMALDAVAPHVFRTRCGDANTHGRAYGGQILGQALMAAARSAPPDRPCTAMQFMFLQGTLHDEALDLHVTPLQDGKRFSSRHVRGVQRGERNVLDAQVSFAVPIAAPAHGAPPAVALEDPDRLPCVDAFPREWAQAVERAIGYQLRVKPVLDFRFAAPPDGLRLELPTPRLRFWVRTRSRLPDDPVLHAAVHLERVRGGVSLEHREPNTEPLLDVDQGERGVTALSQGPGEAGSQLAPALQPDDPPACASFRSGRRGRKRDECPGWGVPSSARCSSPAGCVWRRRSA